MGRQFLRSLRSTLNPPPPSINQSMSSVVWCSQPGDEDSYTVIKDSLVCSLHCDVKTKNSADQVLPPHFRDHCASPDLNCLMLALGRRTRSIWKETLELSSSAFDHQPLLTSFTVANIGHITHSSCATSNTDIDWFGFSGSFYSDPHFHASKQQTQNVRVHWQYTQALEGMSGASKWQDVSCQQQVGSSKEKSS